MPRMGQHYNESLIKASNPTKEAAHVMVNFKEEQYCGPLSLCIGLFCFPRFASVPLTHAWFQTASKTARTQQRGLLV
ncbi:hypothetical protein FOA52_009583 [Chlamydomonas sp. UWO 241]|nr:hypothetical protein FOA52_009583 [Chlamydomonas sp. UWO 241]